MMVKNSVMYPPTTVYAKTNGRRAAPSEQDISKKNHHLYCLSLPFLPTRVKRQHEAKHTDGKDINGSGHGAATVQLFDQAIQYNPNRDGTIGQWMM